MLKLNLFSVGRLSKGPEQDLADRYRKRIAPLARAQGFGSPQLTALPESRKATAAARRNDEAKALLAHMPAGPLIALDERGDALTTAAFAALLAALRDQGHPALHFGIGGPDGFDERVRARAQKVLALGAMTLPHQLVVPLLLEQIYRALTILGGHPYHRG